MVRAPWRRDDDEGDDGRPSDAKRRSAGPDFWEMVRRARTTTDPNEIEHLISLRQPQIDIVFASRIDLGCSMLRRLAAASDDDVALTAMANPLIDARAIREVLRRHPLRAWSRLVRRELVAKPDARRTSLWISARSPHWDVRRNVAAHPATPARRLVGLAKDGSWSVRAAVATNVAAPSKAIQRLLTDHPAVRLELATNPSLSTAVVDMLLGDPDTSISGIASGHPEASPDALGRLLDRDDTPPWIRARIAKSPACPAGRRDEILTWVALGGAGPGDPTFDPRTCMVNPIDATRPVADFVAPIAPTLTSPLWPVRLAMLRQVRAPEASLHRVAARDISPNVRRRAAEFRSRSTLLELSGDRDALVRSAAQRLGGRVGSMRPRRVPVVIGGLAVAVLLAVVAEWDASTGSDSSPPVTLPFTVPEDLVLGPGESRRSATQVVPNVATIALETFGGLASVRIDALTPLTVISIDGLGVSDLPAHVSVGETRSWLGANLDSTRIRVEVDGIVSEYTIAFASDSPNDTSVKEVSGVRGVDSDG